MAAASNEHSAEARASFAPVEPMLAKVADELPADGNVLFEPKWDGFRAIVFRPADGEVSIQSRDLRPFDRYFPELRAALANALPAGCVVDGEIVIVTSHGLDFDALQQRLHPAASRVAKLAVATPASFVVFDLLVEGGASLFERTQAERRARLEQLLESAAPPLYLTPATRDRAVAERWLRDFEGAGLDGVIAKPLDAPYQPGKRAMLKIKHQRSADCVVAGLRWHKSMAESGIETVGSLLLGLYDDGGRLHHVGVTSSFTMDVRRSLAVELAPLRDDALEGHPWRDWAGAAGAEADGQRMPGATSRWSAGKDLAWVALRPERVCEVKYDHLQGDRFRHATTFLRWRPDKPPAACRYDQLEVVAPYELRAIFGSAAG
ncbi:ATP-dependent DNA ligase [Piscinibacter koreensis]|uniref:DNA ligase (ATP) n=1 Tax=Piscinibacter koreensis TaxID=2742824 RepID=A0A7Y6TYK8_9BURK|nr:ATP-dependent DNA ligase [Schlegelella koreensis]NUZ08225.1 ATP-dependent DNA ligase [Schlegelella koreensis]